jgi:hypothetical protein
MRDQEEVILNALKAGRFLLSMHAARRMKQRSVTAADIRACGRTAKCCCFQAQQGTWRIEGEDLDGEILTVVCGIDNEVVVVTIF